MPRRRFNYMDLVPKEILSENIFSRLPVKSLGRCKCVSTSWNSTISDPHFVKTHLKKTYSTNDNTKLITHQPNPDLLKSVAPNSDWIGSRLNFDCPNTWFRIWGSCDGLVLAQDKQTCTSMYLLNPTTLESKQLPVMPGLRSKSKNSYLFGLGYDSASDDYAVVSISYERYCSRRNACVYVYMLGKNYWDKVGLPPYNLRCGAGMFVEGWLHWLAKKLNESSWLIAAFSFANKEFSQVPVPDEVLGSRTILARSLGVVNGCLCVMNHLTNMTSEFWVMNKYGVAESWIKLSIVLSKVYPPVPNHFRSHIVEMASSKLLWVDNNAEPAKPYNCDKVIVYLGFFGGGMKYVESLVSPNNKDENQTKKRRGRKSKTIK